METKKLTKSKMDFKPEDELIVISNKSLVDIIENNKIEARKLSRLLHEESDCVPSISYLSSNGYYICKTIMGDDHLLVQYGMTWYEDGNKSDINLAYRNENAKDTGFLDIYLVQDVNKNNTTFARKQIVKNSTKTTKSDRSTHGFHNVDIEMDDNNLIVSYSRPEAIERTSVFGRYGHEWTPVWRYEDHAEEKIVSIKGIQRIPFDLVVEELHKDAKE